jgi:hypothetical protein
MRSAPDFVSMTGMPTRLREALALLWMLFRRRGGLLALKTEHDGEGRRSADARARFWTDFREGQREAEARSSMPR